MLPTKTTGGKFAVFTMRNDADISVFYYYKSRRYIIVRRECLTYGLHFIVSDVSTVGSDAGLGF